MKRLFIAAAIVVSAVLAQAQNSTLQRRFVPIVLRGAQLPMTNFKPAEWRAFRFQAASGQWQLVPFQADGKDSENKYNKPWSGVLDSNDEMVFMPQDLGDRAPATTWFADPGGRSATRLEFELSESLDPGKKGWIYLYKSGQTPAGYQTHIDAPKGSAADTILTRYYKLGHNRDGWIDFMSMASSPKTDLVDRLKLRLAGNTIFAGIGSYAVIEDTLNNGEYTIWPGLIRTLRDQRTKLSIPQLLITNVPIDYQLTYFPYSMTLGVQETPLQSPQYLVLAGAKTLRQSVDLTPAASGMKFFSEINRSGVNIDGQADAIDATLKTQTGRHWAMASGEQGTVFLIMEMPQVEGGTTKLYYRDSQSGGTNDNTPETGDNKSYCDMGLWAQANGSSSLATDRVTMGFTLYMMPERSRDAVFADSLFAWVQQPLQVQVLEQNDPGTGVALAEKQPGRFALSAAWPNPVQARSGAVQLRVTSVKPGAAGEVRIFNALGQTIRMWSFAARGGQGGELLSWNLRDSQERVVAPGAYYVQIRMDGAEETRIVKVLH